MDKSLVNGIRLGDPKSDPTIKMKIIIDRMMDIIDGYEHHLNDWEQSFVSDGMIRCSKGDYSWTVNQVTKLREIAGKVAKLTQ